VSSPSRTFSGGRAQQTRFKQSANEVYNHISVEMPGLLNPHLVPTNKGRGGWVLLELTCSTSRRQIYEAMRMANDGMGLVVLLAHSNFSWPKLWRSTSPQFHLHMSPLAPGCFSLLQHASTIGDSRLCCLRCETFGSLTTGACCLGHSFITELVTHKGWSKTSELNTKWLCYQGDW